jgi:hypothetical protein
VGEVGAVGPGEGRHRTHLVENVGLDLGGVGRDLAAPEAPQVEVARVRPDRDPRAHRPGDGAIDDGRVPGVEPAGHVGRGDVDEHGLVRAHGVGPEGLPEVGVEIDALAHEA